MPSAARSTFGRWAILIAALSVAFAAAYSSWLRPVEDGQSAIISQLLHREASGQIHIVEVDAKSISEIRQWPWPREHHARLVDELSKAGARSVVFDIDFSSRSTPEADAAFAESIANSEATIVLPTFSQFASEQARTRIDALPIPELRENVTLASASVLPDPDARVRRMVYGTITDELPRPSLSAQLAGVSGAANTSFAIDYSIDPASIPRHSFTDVEAGQFGDQSVAGKDVMVGATAIELGDRYGVPAYGVIPGVTIQVLAAETLIAGAPSEFGFLPLILLAAVIGALALRRSSYTSLSVTFAAGAAALFGVQAFAYHGGSVILEIMPAALALSVCAIAQGLRIAVSQYRQKSMVDEESQLPNAAALLNREASPDQFIATAFIKEFDAIQAVLNKDEIGQLIRRVDERLGQLTGADTRYRTDTRVLAWVHEGDDRALIKTFEKIGQAMLKPVEVAGKRIDVLLTFGIAAGIDIGAAASAANTAAKEGLLWHAHEAAEAAILEQRVSLMGELDQAIDRDELQVVYQPKRRLATDQIESVEALVRWNHQERGNLPPDLFIPLAEESNRIERLTLYVLQQTIADLKCWCANRSVVSAAVNISAKLVSSEGFVAAAEHILRETGVPRDRLIFEVTESATMRDPDVAAQNLTRFRDLGVQISMDDYGTGQSTLSYLQVLPLTELKIDRAFVQNAHIERSDALLVRSTIQLAHSLGLRVVGEGVEEEACLEFLREAGCDYAQGYHVSKPLTAEAVAPLLTKISNQVRAE